jgi:hypothetical protein
MRTTFLYIVSLTMITGHSIAQDSSSLTVSGYAEIYYSYDFNKPVDNNRPGFFYSHNRHNEFNLNLGFIKAAYSAGRVRANLALAGGTYINSNYASEPGVLKNIFEANAGIRISRTKDLWLDAGIFSSHIGFESAVSKDCWTLTRSIVAENSPYYESGVRLSYGSGDGKWLVSALALNGWQRITRVTGNSMMSWGAQVQYKPSEKLLLNYSNFIGTDKPDSARLIRTYHNFYAIWSLNDHLGLTAGLDIGTQDKSSTRSGTDVLVSPLLILRCSLDKRWALAGRVEYYQDKAGILVNSPSANGFRVMGYSANIDYAVAKSVLVRFEARTLHGVDAVFERGERPVKSNSFVTASMAIAF